MYEFNNFSFKGPSNVLIIIMRCINFQNMYPAQEAVPERPDGLCGWANWSWYEWDTLNSEIQQYIDLKSINWNSCVKHNVVRSDGCSSDIHINFHLARRSTFLRTFGNSLMCWVQRMFTCKCIHYTHIRMIRTRLVFITPKSNRINRKCILCNNINGNKNDFLLR